jgi:transcriptional regulator with XRE-family HTH domain
MGWYGWYNLRMDQKTFLQLAKRELRLTYPQLAAAIGVSPRTMEKWSLNRRSDDYRQMPLIAQKFICKLLEDEKRMQILAGNRATSETIDAIVARVSTEKYLESLHTFDALQKSANAIVRMTLARDKPRYFKQTAAKNAWNAKEEIRNARRTGKASAIAR